MPRLTAKDFQPEVLRLFDQNVHGEIPGRGFLQGEAQQVAPGEAFIYPKVQHRSNNDRVLRG
jgi:hypothetical protein